MAPSNLPLFLLLATATPLIAGQLSDYPTANLSTLWTNNNASLKHSVTYGDGSVVRAIILRSPKDGFGPSFAAGFFCPSAPCDSAGAFLFAVFIVYTNSGAGITSVINGIPQVVWSANRIRPVKENATLELTGDGNLILRDADGAGVWSSSTTGRSIAGMMITELGNLVLFDQKNATVWQSFEHPTDALVPGQSLLEGMRLTANTSATNWTQNQLYLTVLHDGLYAYVDSIPPQPYFKELVNKNNTGNHLTQFTLTNGSFGTPDDLDSRIQLPAAKSTQYMRFENDGHLRLYEWSVTEAKWVLVYDVIKMFPDDDCAFPTVCGEYGVCTGGQCSCPFQSNSTSSYFKPINGWKPNIGCMPLTPISIANARNSDDCKQACLKNCSCQAVMFTYGQNEFNGDCLWVTRVFSLQSIQPQILHYNSSAYLKVQLSTSPSATTGYLAPEWLTSQITEKVDIYSFGVVVMEVICGRKNIDNSQPEENIHLINLLQEKARNNRLIDMIDKHSHDMVTHQDKVIQMMKLAMWCLQHDSSRRPLMSMVVKVLEGTMTVETSIDYNFFSSDPVLSVQGDQSAHSAPPLASVLSNAISALLQGDAAGGEDIHRTALTEVDEPVRDPGDMRQDRAGTARGESPLGDGLGRAQRGARPLGDGLGGHGATGRRRPGGEVGVAATPVVVGAAAAARRRPGGAGIGGGRRGGLG